LRVRLHFDSRVRETVFGDAPGTALPRLRIARTDDVPARDHRGRPRCQAGSAALAADRRGWESKKIARRWRGSARRARRGRKGITPRFTAARGRSLGW